MPPKRIKKGHTRGDLHYALARQFLFKTITKVLPTNIAHAKSMCFDSLLYLTLSLTRNTSCFHFERGWGLRFSRRCNDIHFATLARRNGYSTIAQAKQRQAQARRNNPGF